MQVLVFPISIIVRWMNKIVMNYHSVAIRSGIVRCEVVMNLDVVSYFSSLSFIEVIFIVWNLSFDIYSRLMMILVLGMSHINVNMCGKYHASLNFCSPLVGHFYLVTKPRLYLF